MQITVAESAGFCFGVNRAVQMVYSALERNEPVATLGPIIHNPQVVKYHFSTSNHNFCIILIFMLLLSNISFLHQTTTYIT